MHKFLFAAGLALLLSGASAAAQDGTETQDQPTMPQDQTVPQQPQAQPPTNPQPQQDEGVGGAGGQQQAPPTAAPQPQDQGVGGAGAGQQACPCPDCPANQQQGMRGGMGMGTGMGPMGFGARLGELANVTVEDTNEGAVIRLNAQNPEQVEEVRALARALASTWEAMGLRSGQQPQQQQPPPQ